MSLPVVDDTVEALGHKEMFISYYYVIPNMEIFNGLRKIKSDADVQTMCTFVPNVRVIEMYIEELSPE